MAFSTQGFQAVEMVYAPVICVAALDRLYVVNLKRIVRYDAFSEPLELCHHVLIPNACFLMELATLPLPPCPPSHVTEPTGVLSQFPTNPFPKREPLRVTIYDSTHPTNKICNIVRDCSVTATLHTATITFNRSRTSVLPRVLTKEESGALIRTPAAGRFPKILVTPTTEPGAVPIVERARLDDKLGLGLAGHESRLAGGGDRLDSAEPNVD